MEGDGEGGLAEIVTLRPVAWIDQVEAEVGGSVYLELEEMGVRGTATVLAIEPCPPIAPRPGRVVLSTTVRYGVPVLTLSLAGTDEPLQLTPGHRLFSEDRGDWVPAGELQPGERLRTRTGSVAVAAIEPKPGLHTVFNLEVETDHCYLVGQAQVLSHNVGTCGASIPPINLQKQAGHIPGTPQYVNRIKQGKPTSSFFGAQSADQLTRKAYQSGNPLPNRPNVREYDFGVSVGTGPDGGMVTKVRVHEGADSIHGHPVGPERF